MLITRYKSIPSSSKVAANATIKKGQPVALNADGEVVLADSDAGDTTAICIGLAGDDKASLTPGQFTNRLFEYGDETLASGKITVHKGPGEFYVDFEDVISDATVANGDYLTVSTTPGKLTTTGATAANAVALVIDDLSATEGYLPSGIPGVNSPLNGTAVKFALIQWLA